MQVLVFIVGLSKSFSCHWCLYRNFVVENRKFGGDIGLFSQIVFIFVIVYCAQCPNMN